MVLLNEHLFPADFNLIISKKHVISMKDYHCWIHTKSGEYTVSLGYWLANQSKHVELIREANMLPSPNGIKAHVWNLKTNHKIKLFLWRVLSGAVSVADNLAHRGMDLDMRCQPCGVAWKLSIMLFSPVRWLD